MCRSNQEQVMAKHSEEFLRKAAEARQRITEIEPEAVDQQVQQGAVLIDVRDEEEFNAGHIDGATHVPRSTLEDRIAEVVPDKQTPIVAYCGGGNRGALAADTLQDLGYQDVMSIAGGMANYKAQSEK
jgi:phage shock protein E